MRIEDKTNNLQEQSSLGLKGIDYLELYVGNATQAMHFYRMAFGFTPVAYAGLETGTLDYVSYLLRQDNINLLLTSPLNSHGPIADHVRLHGDGIKDVALCVDDATYAFEESVKKGAIPVMEPIQFDGPHGRIIKATIETFGDTVHSFVERNCENGCFFPHFQPVKSMPAATTRISNIDHIAVSLEKGKLDYWVDFYTNVLGFRISHKEDVLTEYSGMNSRVVESETGEIKFPMMEPAAGKRKSQIEEYLSFYGGPGAQHIAFLSEDIIGSVRMLQSNGIDFLQTPVSYYESLQERVGPIEEDVAILREFNILVDRDKWGYLMQVFTLPLQERPTLFVEVIQRKGACGFGGGNIKALFEAVEREQEKRGGL
jgi:4-hydroxyphenylpyruvate dioxygenase